ncbi:MAG: phytoene desaturase family protein [Ginsengibacter sp.]
MRKIIVIGAGFSGLSAAAYLAAKGFEVHVYEKNASAGGRASQMKTSSGYVFDMGPSWYWMPEVFEKFFNDFGFKANDFYELDLLNPGFEIVFPKGELMKIPASFEELCNLFESVETGAAEQLREFMKEAKYKYDTGMGSLSSMPGNSVTEFMKPDLIKGFFRLQIFSSFKEHIQSHFKDPRLLSIMEFPVIFLGAMADKMPALYSLMNYAGLKLGTWYPQGGFGAVVESMVKVGKREGVHFHYNSGVDKILVSENRVRGIEVDGEIIEADAIIATADYHFVEKELLPEEFRNYPESYWDKKTLAPSSLIFYLGISKKLDKLEHHTLFFDEDLELHTKEIYDDPQWPTKPLFYVCCPSKTDKKVAPVGHENLFILMPLAAGIEDTKELRNQYFDILMKRLESHAGEKISEYIDFNKSYCINDFLYDYNSYKGNAYGLANTLRQTAILKPKMKNRKLKNLFYAGQLTVPGPGVPPSIISGKMAATQLIKHLKRTHETII